MGRNSRSKRSAVNPGTTCSGARPCSRNRSNVERRQVQFVDVPSSTSTDVWSGKASSDRLLRRKSCRKRGKYAVRTRRAKASYVSMVTPFAAIAPVRSSPFHFASARRRSMALTADEALCPFFKTVSPLSAGSRSKNASIFSISAAHSSRIHSMDPARSNNTSSIAAPFAPPNPSGSGTPRKDFVGPHPPFRRNSLTCQSASPKGNPDFFSVIHGWNANMWTDSAEHEPVAPNAAGTITRIGQDRKEWGRQPHPFWLEKPQY